MGPLVPQLRQGHRLPPEVPLVPGVPGINVGLCEVDGGLKALGTDLWREKEDRWNKVQNGNN